MSLVTTWVIVPLSLSALVTGVLISIVTRWGLFRHWWVVVSLLLTTVALLVLLVETAVITRGAAMAAAVTTPDVDVLNLPPTLLHSIGGLLVLLVVHWLNVFKPAGLTPYGWRKQQQERSTA